ncbi:hypothetical protein PM082_024691 [Marasmius tenuissimus]|nr:hypothetical protein PM082_024691 [Marasmius tenuissimus]
MAYAVERNRFGAPGYSRSHASLLCKVCTFWRSVALDTPYIWGTATIDASFDANRYPLVVERLKTHIERSRGNLLTYEIDLPHKIICLDRYHPILEALFGIVERPERAEQLKFVLAPIAHPHSIISSPFSPQVRLIIQS